MRLLTSLALMILWDIAFGQSRQSDRTDVPTEGTQMHAVWQDPATGSFWAVKDNGRDVSAAGAKKYCRELRLAGYSDWRLPNIGELARLFDPKVESAGLAGTPLAPSTWHIKGNIYLTGHPWSSGRGYVWFMNFNSGEPDRDPTGFFYPYVFRRALCIHGAER